MAGKKGCGRKPILPEPDPRECNWCGTIFTPIRKKWKQSFCSLPCQRRAAIASARAKYSAQADEVAAMNSNPSSKSEVSAEFIAWRAQQNREIARATALQRGNALRGRGQGKTYRKLMGRHEHRVVAERMLGRDLLPGEVVHHINGNIHDNRPENLDVLPSQSVHASIHMRWRLQGK